MSNPPAFTGFTGFGNTANQSNQQQGAGATGTGGAAATPSLFGTAAAGSGGLFGASAANTSSSNAPKPFAFGATPAAGTAAGGLFGGTAATGSANTSTAPPTSLFSKPGGLFGNNAAGTANPATTPGAATPAPGATGGGLFGASSTAAPSTTGGLFGGGGLFGTKPGTAAGTPAPTAGSLFGTTPKPAEGTAGPTTTPAAPSLFGGGGTTTTAPGGSLFGPKPATGTGTPTPGTSTPVAPSLFGAPTSSATPAPATTVGSGGLGLFGALGKKEDGKDTPAAATTTAPAAPALFGATKPTTTTGVTPGATGASLFGAPAAGKDTKDAAPTKPSLFGGVPPTANPGATTTTAPGSEAPKATTSLFGATTSAKPTDTTAPAAVPGATTTSTDTKTSAPLLPPSVLKGKALEDIVDQWAADLEVQAVEFKRLATEVQEWDRILIDNGNQIAALHTAVLAAESMQAGVEKSLDLIEEQQKQMSDSLAGWEESAGNILDGQGMRTMELGPADAERGKNYALATSLNAQLDGLARSLSTMIDEVNNVTAPSSHRALKSADNTASLAASATQAGDGPDEADPMTQIQSILNAHLESLSWINDTVRELENKVVGLERKFGTAVPAQEERRAPAPLARGGGSHLYRSTMLEGDSPLPTSRRGYGLR